MTGHHQVKVFNVSPQELHRGTHLPEGWKPFACDLTKDGWVVVARKWEREE
jgi:hypothetical protein